MNSGNSSKSDGEVVTPEALQQIIIQRKAEQKEKAEHRLQMDRQRIKERKSTGGTPKPLEIIPIMGSDHKLFQGLMESSRVRDILFPQILGTASYDDSTFALKYKVLRGVAKSLKHEIDRYYEQHLLKLMRSETEIDYRSLGYVPNLIETLSSSGVEKEIPRRLFTRSIYIRLPVSQIQFDRHRNDIISFLEQVGDQIWYFHCSYNDTYHHTEDPRMSIHQIYSEFNNFLMYMPNLKWLKLQLVINAPQGRESIYKTLDDQPPQKLYSLERIDFQSSHRKNAETRAIFEAVLNANSHIKTLFERGLGGSMSHDILKTLNLEALIRNTSTLQDIVNYNWQLKRIHLVLNASELSINSFFRTLENLHSLEYLDLGIINPKFEKELKYLRLPNLARLKMHVFPHNDACLRDGESSRGAYAFFSLQFLLFASKLKSLAWADRSPYPDFFRECLEKQGSGKTGIDFCGGWKDLSGSNIWDVFPQLEKVKTVCKDENNEPFEIHRKYSGRTLVHTSFSRPSFNF